MTKKVSQLPRFRATGRAYGFLGGPLASADLRHGQNTALAGGVRHLGAKEGGS